MHECTQILSNLQNYFVSVFIFQTYELLRGITLLFILIYPFYQKGQKGKQKIYVKPSTLLL